VEVDETFIGGQEHGLRGGRQPGKKVLAGIAVEVSEPKGIGRCRMAVLADASGASPGSFAAGNLEPGSRVITDGWVGYNGLASRGYDHERRNQKAAARRGEDPGELLPAVHRVASLCKRWLPGTHQGKVDPAHLQAYLNEFVFRFNRRNSRSPGMVFYRVLDLAAGHEPVRYDDIRITKKPRSKPPQQRGTGHPPSLNRPAAARPWRTAEMQLQFPLRLSGYPGAQYEESLRFEGLPAADNHGLSLSARSRYSARRVCARMREASVICESVPASTTCAMAAATCSKWPRTSSSTSVAGSVTTSHGTPRACRWICT
jgi:hypothetical protein